MGNFLDDDTELEGKTITKVKMKDSTLWLLFANGDYTTISSSSCYGGGSELEFYQPTSDDELIFFGMKTQAQIDEENKQEAQRLWQEQRDYEQYRKLKDRFKDREQR